MVQTSKSWFRQVNHGSDKRIMFRHVIMVQAPNQANPPNQINQGPNLTRNQPDLTEIQQRTFFKLAVGFEDYFLSIGGE